MTARRVRQLHVFLEGRPAGLLDRDANGRLSFTYHDHYPRDATPLSPSLPVTARRATHDAVAPFIAGLLPDDTAVLQTWARLFGLRSASAFGLLAEIGADCAGAIQFLPEERLALLDEEGLEGLSETDVEEMLRSLRVNPLSWMQPGDARGGHFSLAGAQTKCALHRSSHGWARPFGRVPSTHIVKPSIQGVTDHDITEHLCLTAAALLGLPAARSEIGVFGSERALVVERFDRVHAPDGSLRRVHQVDMCQALGVLPERKYHSDGGPGPLEIISTLRDTFAGEADVQRFVRSLVFNWVIGGTDGHAKNYGLLLSGGSARLTPLYDVASAGVLDNWNWHKWELAMRVGGEGRLKYLAARHWQRFAMAAGVSFDLIVDAAEQYCTGVGAALSDAADSLPDPSDPHVARLIDAIDAQASTVRTALLSGR